jgi:bifunctional DNA-binding transcriptional regulator/antitoxin component of YhaV-PrlF toxin-antitoxin module
MTDENKRIIYEVVTQEGEDGELLLPIPPQMLKDLGWKEGTELKFDKDDKGRFILRKA